MCSQGSSLISFPDAQDGDRPEELGDSLIYCPQRPRPHSETAELRDARGWESPAGDSPPSTFVVSVPGDSGSGECPRGLASKSDLTTNRGAQPGCSLPSLSLCIPIRSLAPWAPQPPCGVSPASGKADGLAPAGMQRLPGDGRAGKERAGCPEG